MLSLFFIDEVAKYKQYDAHGNAARGIYAQIFEEEYHSIIGSMQLSLEEAQYLLKLGQRGELYPRNRRDAALIYCIQHKLNLIDTELMLDQLGEEMLE